MVFSGRACTTGPFLWVGTGAPGLKPGAAAGGSDNGGSEDDDDTPGCLVVRFGAATEKKEVMYEILGDSEEETVPSSGYNINSSVSGVPGSYGGLNTQT